MQKLMMGFLIILAALFSANSVNAAADLEVNTPAISALKNSMQARHTQLAPHYGSGAIGLTSDGLIAVRDTTAVPLRDRQGINALVATENADRNALYKEIAAGNGHPEWRGDIQSTFAGRWIDKAQGGWWYQKEGSWVKK
ncbi:MAG: YdbL family protein [Methylotenera sp.]|nr:YdbL family protein [Methylotenera sp.]